MKYGMMMKALGILFLSTVGLGAGVAKADGRGCQSLSPNPYTAYVHPAPIWDWHSRQGGERWDDRIDFRQHRQTSLIRYGVQTGQITPREAQRLMTEQREIDRLQRQFMADGYLSPQERRRLELALQEARSNIREELRDRQYRW
jgi:DNA-binding CsgD family transcriptional regulator